MAEKKEKQASSLPRPLRLFYGAVTRLLRR